MSLFATLRAERLIAQIKTGKEPQSVARAAAKLQTLGPAAVAPVMAALADAEKHQTLALVDVLSALITAKNLEQFLQALQQGNARTVAGVSWALSSSRNYPPSMLLEALLRPGVAKGPLLDVIKAQRHRFTPRDLLTASYAQDANEKAQLFRLISEMATDELVPELCSRLQGKDPLVRLHIINLLSRFNATPVRKALLEQLQDSNKMIRGAALTALARLSGPTDIEAICQLLRDPEIDVQNKAIDFLIKVNDPQTVQYLLPALKDENEYARRAAVEVLNEVGDTRSVKFLLAAIKDADWWVRSRAGDALGKIGGPKVIEAVLNLAKDEDPDLRRAAIEILNQTHDESAVNHLIEATRDPDWWVCERAIDALAAIGSQRALPRLLEMLEDANPRALPVVIHAIGKLGDTRQIEQLLPWLAKSEKPVRVEVIAALVRLSDERRFEAIKIQLQAQAVSADATIVRAANAGLQSLELRFASGATQQSKLDTSGNIRLRPPETPKPQSHATAAIRDRARALEQAGQGHIDLSLLRAGDLIEGRYRYVQRIGKGAFGTVVLVDDTVVDEQLILKFLNPSVSEDEEAMKRFVHELRYSRKITHKNIIRIYDFLRIQGHYAISMEYFPSHTLGSEIINEQPLPLSRLLQFGIDMATGMAVAHQVGVVHRDLKPANVLINSEGLLKIVDFGVAAAHREGDTQLTRTGYVIGSPKYMAPEQILGRKVDERADIYSTGIILYELAAGVPPYARGDHMAVMYQHVQGKARPPHEINPHLPPPVGEVIMKAMAADKAKRFQTMAELQTALEQLNPSRI